jgi:hypothetical protein
MHFGTDKKNAISLGARYFLSKGDRSVRMRAMRLKYVFRQIEPNNANILHGPARWTMTRALRIWSRNTKRGSPRSSGWSAVRRSNWSF